MLLASRQTASPAQELVALLVNGSQPENDADGTVVKMLLLDHVFVAARGSQSAAADAFMRFLKDSGPATSGGHVVFGSHTRASAPYAAMANAIAANTLELDDTHNGSATHPGSVIFPAAVAAAITAHADGPTFIRGVIRGYELMCRLGRTLDGAELHRRHALPTGISGHLGAAMAVASIFDLDEDEVFSAIGIAAAGASGSLQFLEDGAWTKQLSAAYAARDGYEAAILARAGYRGTHDAISGGRGLLAAFDAVPRSHQLLDALGSRPREIHATSIKMHACCLYMHSALDAIVRLREESVDPAEIRQLTVGLFSEALHVVWTPESSRRPTTVEEAQFSLPFAAAVVAIDGAAGVAQFTAQRLTDPETLAFMERVSCVADSELDASYPEKKSAWVEVAFANGERRRVSVDAAEGDPSSPVPTERHIAKLATLHGRPSSVDVVCRLLDDLDSVPDAGELFLAVAKHANLQ